MLKYEIIRYFISLLQKPTEKKTEPFRSVPVIKPIPVRFG